MTQRFDEDLAWFAVEEMQQRYAKTGQSISMSQAMQMVETKLYPRCTCKMRQGLCVRGTGDCMSGRLIEE